MVCGGVGGDADLQVCQMSGGRDMYAIVEFSYNVAFLVKVDKLSEFLKAVDVTMVEFDYVGGKGVAHVVENKTVSIKLVNELPMSAAEFEKLKKRENEDK